MYLVMCLVSYQQSRIIYIQGSSVRLALNEEGTSSFFAQCLVSCVRLWLHLKLGHMLLCQKLVTFGGAVIVWPWSGRLYASFVKCLVSCVGLWPRTEAGHMLRVWGNIYIQGSSVVLALNKKGSISFPFVIPFIIRIWRMSHGIRVEETLARVLFSQTAK